MAGTSSSSTFWQIADVFDKRLRRWVDQVTEPLRRGSVRTCRLAHQSDDLLVRIDIALYEQTGRFSLLLAHRWVEVLKGLRLMPLTLQVLEPVAAKSVVIDLTDSTSELVPVG